MLASVAGAAVLTAAHIIPAGPHLALPGLVKLLACPHLAVLGTRSGASGAGLAHGGHGTRSATHLL